MLKLSKFYGIVIRMLFKKSLAAQFHAIYDGQEVIVGIKPMKIIQGNPPLRIRKILIAWTFEHQQELLRAWQFCSEAKAPQPIEPLHLEEEEIDSYEVVEDDQNYVGFAQNPETIQPAINSAPSIRVIAPNPYRLFQV